MADACPLTAFAVRVVLPVETGCPFAALGAAFLRRGDFLLLRPRPFCGDGAIASPMAVTHFLYLSGTDVPPVPGKDATPDRLKYQHF
jgi:hypothetical protein